MIKLKDLLKELESKDNYYIANNIMEPRLAVRKYFNANKDSLEVLMDQDRWHEVYQIIFKQFPQFEQHILSTAINNEALDAGWLTKQVPVNAKLSLDVNSEVGEIQTTISAWVAKNKNKLIKLADDDDYTKFYQAARDQFPGVQDDKLLFALKVAAVEHDIHYDVLTDGVIKLKDLLKESKYSELLYHGGDVDFNKPMYFSDSLLIAQSYGKVTGPYQITLDKFITLDFSTAEGWWLPEIAAKNEVKKFGMKLEDFDKYKSNPEIKSIKTDHFVRAAIDKGFDGIVFQNIMDAGSHPVKGNKYIRTTNVVAINPTKSAKLKKD